MTCIARDGDLLSGLPLNETKCQFAVNVLDADLSISGPTIVTSGVPVTVTLTVRNGTTTVTCRFANALANGATATIAITANGAPPSLPRAGVTTLTSTATVGGTAPDFNQANNSAVLAVRVTASTPALSPWMLIALAMFAAATALLRMR